MPCGNVSPHFAVSHFAVYLYRDRDRVRVRVRDNYTTPRNGEVGNGEMACHRAEMVYRPTHLVAAKTGRPSILLLVAVFKLMYSIDARF